MDIYFKASGQSLRRSDCRETAENSLLYLKSVFELDEEWSDTAVTKTAVFTKPDGTAYHVLLGSDGCAANEAYSAQEVLREGFFTVGLIGVKGSGASVVRMTTNTVTVNVERAGALDGENTDVTASLADQIEAALGRCEVKSERVPYIGVDGYWYYYSYTASPEGWVKGEKAQGEKGAKGEKGDPGDTVEVDLSDYYTKTETDGMLTEHANSQNAHFNLFAYKRNNAAQCQVSGTPCALSDNTEYRLSDVGEMAFTFPSGNFECWLRITTASGGTVSLTFPQNARFIGEAPAVGNGETWEISVKDGVVAAAKVGDGT